MVIYSTNEDGKIIVLFDSRWQFPELFGYRPEDPEYKLLRKLWEEASEKTIPEEHTTNQETEALLPTG